MGPAPPIAHGLGSGASSGPAPSAPSAPFGWWSSWCRVVALVASPGPPAVLPLVPVVPPLPKVRSCMFSRACMRGPAVCSCMRRRASKPPGMLSTLDKARSCARIISRITAGLDWARMSSRSWSLSLRTARSSGLDSMSCLMEGSAWRRDMNMSGLSNKPCIIGESRSSFGMPPKAPEASAALAASWTFPEVPDVFWARVLTM